jgi:hypothetical protein
MSERKKPWIERTAPAAPFLVLLAAVAVAAYHVAFHW